MNRVLVRSTTRAGKIVLSAASGGLKGSEVRFSSRPVEVSYGLSTKMPADNLPVYLERGPTPPTPSYQTFRVSVPIAGARAGANQDQAADSYDGSQGTRWTNDGTLETGWIEYTLEKKALVSEIALKPSGWRTRRYPIVVSANDSILYRGITPPNLGFFYVIPDQPVRTDNLKVRLFGPEEYKQVYRTAEITGKLDRETAGDRAVRNATNLNIVEMEVFESK